MEKALRVLLLTHSYSPEHSPPQRRWTQFVRAFRHKGWAVDVVAPVAHAPNGRRVLPRNSAGRPFRKDEGKYGERILRVPFLWHKTTRLGRLLDHCFSAFFSTLAGLCSPKPTVVIVTVPSLPILGAGFVVARLRKLPLIVDMRDAWPDIARDARLVQGRAKSLAERLIMAVQERADLVVTVTDGFARTLKSRGIRRVKAISNGVDTAVRELLPPPPAEADKLRVLYLGNHGESQRLEVVVRAAALARKHVELTMVGHGVQRRALIELAEALDAPVEFHGPALSPEVMEFYRSADTCVVSLRDDWKSFETTVPSKTYEVLAVGRHVTGIVLGEAKKIIEESGAGAVVPSDPVAVADLWKRLASDRTLLLTGTSGRDWIHENANLESQCLDYIAAIESLAGAGAK
ncbi:glycosyltransferase family 4 protein [Arthrobacter sp. ATA002]|uniref:glycosyltransferase family 4 protein n=1 Tax=Arthrobacter sp. ATA002 TaxID=2991715 RepID=UPI0022A6CE9F|nr:glycosyltransferase family 4 protein [Arthrobacter sp. ATA002]WAP52901.1 glycosyltransferase family 4 protein [Arthrobacter sp. ATA002]